MIKLTVQNFACIASAELRAPKFTLVIGPQASGKSVLAKLLYFFNDQLMKQHTAAQSATSVQAWLNQIEHSFAGQFPAGAWGSKPFKIVFEAGEYVISMHSDPAAPSGARAEANGECIEDYRRLLAEYDHLKKRVASAGDDKAPTILSFDQYWPVQQNFQDEREVRMGGDYVAYQLFVPAGRSFFTTLGKTAIALGNSVVSDTITQQFGRLITSLRDEAFPLSDQMELRGTAVKILGGKVAKEGEREVLRSPDGRQIPLNLMSSGQQEFYPLAISLAYVRYFPNIFTFIEEPEAHLFPAAQSQLIDLLVDTIADYDDERRMLITTHSPYCLSKLNNLLKAGSLAKQRPDLAAQIAQVVPENRWLTPEGFAAYGIIDGELVPLLDEDGLIDSGYLDSISADLAGEFGDLMELEFGRL